jgi:bis(5'-nucleosyl)-tetraphosphatase (symmetrical)
MATYAIGDIQGCYSALRRLLRRVHYAPATDRLWLVGDLVNRGPQSRDVLHWAADQGERVRMVLGNHDVHLIGRHYGVSERKKRDTLDDVLEAPDAGELVEWLCGQPLLVHEGEWVMVHAALHPEWSLEEAERLAREGAAALRGEQRKQALRDIFEDTPKRWEPSLGPKKRLQLAYSVLTRLRIMKREGELELGFSGAPHDIPDGCAPWFEIATRRSPTNTVVFGHWAALGLYLSPRYVGLDTGCVWGKTLTAMRLEDRKIFQEPAEG